MNLVLMLFEKSQKSQFYNTKFLKTSNKVRNNTKGNQSI